MAQPEEPPGMDIFDPEFSTATIPPTILVRLCDLADEHGVDIEPWFLGTGVLPSQLDVPETRVSHRQATTIIRRALRAMPDGPIGLAAGSRNAIVGFGLVGFAMRSAATIGDAIALGIEMHRLTGCLMDPELNREGELSTFRVFERIPDPESVRFLTEAAIAQMVSFGRSLLGEGMPPVVVRLSYPEPEYVADYRRFFRCPIEFDCDVNEVVIPTALLERPITTRSEANLAAAVDACKQLDGGPDIRHDTVASVEAILGENLRRPMSMAEVAERLYATERTLRRRLHAAGEKFSDIRDRVRQRRALFLVRETGMTIAQIAAETGYSNAREFRRAYVRWNGEPPSRTRSTGGLPGEPAPAPMPVDARRIA